MADHPEMMDTHHGDRDINVKVIVLAGIACVVFAVLMHTGIWWLFKDYRADARRAEPPRLSYATKVQGPPANFPRLQDGVVTPTPADWDKQWKAIEAKRETEYAWIDRQHGVVRIPIDQAMNIVEEEGLPARTSPVPAETSLVATPQHEGAH